MEKIKYTKRQLEILKILREQTFCEKNLYEIFSLTLSTKTKNLYENCSLTLSTKVIFYGVTIHNIQYNLSHKINQSVCTCVDI